MVFLSPPRDSSWIAEAFGVGRMDSYQLVSHVMKAEVSQLVDPNYTILVKLL